MGPDDGAGAPVVWSRGFGLAYLHLVESDMDPKAAPGFDTGRLRAAFDGTYIANGGYDRDRAETVIARGAADLVAFGQLYLANPDLVARFDAATALNTPDPATFYGGDARGYTDYPFLAGQAA